MKIKAVERSHMWFCVVSRRWLYPPVPSEQPPRPDEVPLNPPLRSVVTGAEIHTGTQHSAVKVLVPVPWGFFMLLCKRKFLRKSTPDIITVATLIVDLQWWPSPQFSQVSGWGWKWGNFTAIDSQTTPLPVFIPSFSWAKTDSVQNDFC